MVGENEETHDCLKAIGKLFHMRLEKKPTWAAFELAVVRGFAAVALH